MIVTIFISVHFSGCTDTKQENEDNSSITLTVTPSIITFSVSPYSIEEGNTAELLWNVKNATSIFIDNGIGNVSLMGSRIITPLITTTYTLFARNGDIETQASCYILVTKVDYELKLVGTWNCTLGELGKFYKTLLFRPDKTAIFGEMNPSNPSGWGSGSEFDKWSVENGILITIQELDFSPYRSYINWTIRFDGDVLFLKNVTYYPDWESRYEKIS